MLALAVFAIADTMGPLASTRSSIANQGSCLLKRHAIRRPAFPTSVCGGHGRCIWNNDGAACACNDGFVFYENTCIYASCIVNGIVCPHGTYDASMNPPGVFVPLTTLVGILSATRPRVSPIVRRIRLSYVTVRDHATLTPVCVAVTQQTQVLLAKNARRRRH